MIRSAGVFAHSMHLAWAALVLGASSPAGEVNRQAIDDVATGRIKVAKASWWGFRTEDSTKALQAAIDSGVPKLIVEDMGAPWIVTPIRLRSNQEIEFEKGVELLAKRGEYKGGGATLVTARNVENVVLRGYGATFRMWREDYDNPDLYKKAEWRHCLSIWSSSNVKVLGLRLENSGGDGIYLGTATKWVTNRDIVIRDVLCESNYRQGISVITAESLLIENTVMRTTRGTRPEAGIDFEPNHPEERLADVVMRNCLSENNTYGYLLNLSPHSAGSERISLRFENCRAIKNTGRGFSYSIVRNTTDTPPRAPGDVESRRPEEDLVNIVMRGCVSEGNAGTGYFLNLQARDDGSEAVSVRLEDCRSYGDSAIGCQVVASVGGSISFKDCVFERCGGSGISVSKPAERGAARFERCQVLDCAATQSAIAPIMFASNPGADGTTGGVVFDSVLVRDALERPPMRYNDLTGGTPVRGVTGTLRIVARDGQPTPVKLTDELIAQWLPPATRRDIPRLSIEGVALAPLEAELPPVAAVRSPWPLVRGTGAYVLYAEAGDDVTFTVHYLQVGRYPGGEMPVSITGPSGEEVHRQNALFKQSTVVRFTAPSTGLYRFVLNARYNRWQIAAASNAMALVLAEKSVGLNRSGGRFIFYVPPGTREFGVRVVGQGTGEGIKATLLDPRGEVFGQVDNQFRNHQFEVSLDPPSTGEVWTLVLARPSEMVWDDHSVDLRGVPPLLSAAGTTPLVPVRQP